MGKQNYLDTCPVDDYKLDEFTDNSDGLTCYGCFSSSDISFAQRLKVLKLAHLLISDYSSGAKEIDWVSGRHLEPRGETWDGTLDDIAGLRCEGLVEVCHELSGVNVWGKINGATTDYDVHSFLAEHNAGSKDAPDWKKFLYPTTQCGHKDFDDYEGTEWNTTFIVLDLCSPIGHKGGN